MGESTKVARYSFQPPAPQSFSDLSRSQERSRILIIQEQEQSGGLLCGAGWPRAELEGPICSWEAGEVSLWQHDPISGRSAALRLPEKGLFMGES